MWRRLPAGVAGLALILSLGTAAAPPDVPLLRSGDARAAAAADAPVGRVATAVARLGIRMRATAEGNWVASPLSVAYAYAMLRAGAGGHTAAALDELFGVPAQDLHDAFNAITTRVTGDQVAIANGLFLQEGFPVGGPFLRTLATRYGTGVHPLDFTDRKSALVVNEWVRDHTNGRIPGIFEWQPGVQAVLANAIHLDADWARPFTRGATPMPFESPDGPVTVPMLAQAMEVRYAEGDGWQAADLPYRDSDLVFRVLLPAPGADPTDLLRDPAIGAAMRPHRIDLRMPRFQIRTRAELAPVGPPELFGPADLSGIAPGLQISQAVHEAWIRVDEEGTEAAAATGVAMIVSAEQPPTTKLHADRPFAFAIVHRPTDLPLFVGRVTDPR
jgi:serine protease inhibitor